MRPSRLRRSLGATRNKSSQNELVRIVSCSTWSTNSCVPAMASRSALADYLTPPDATTPNRKTGPDNARAGREAVLFN